MGQEVEDSTLRKEGFSRRKCRMLAGSQVGKRGRTMSTLLNFSHSLTPLVIACLISLLSTAPAAVVIVVIAVVLLFSLN